MFSLLLHVFQIILFNLISTSVSYPLVIWSLTASTNGNLWFLSHQSLCMHHLNGPLQIVVFNLFDVVQVRSNRGMWSKQKRTKVFIVWSCLLLHLVFYQTYFAPWSSNHSWYLVLNNEVWSLLQVDEARDILATVVFAHVPVRSHRVLYTTFFWYVALASKQIGIYDHF